MCLPISWGGCRCNPGYPVDSEFQIHSKSLFSAECVPNIAQDVLTLGKCVWLIGNSDLTGRLYLHLLTRAALWGPREGWLASAAPANSLTHACCKVREFSREGRPAALTNQCFHFLVPK